MYLSLCELSNIYSTLLEEGVEEKIPKLLSLVPLSNNIAGFKIQNDENKADFIRWVSEMFDPSPNGMYLGWILKMFKNGVLRGEEDAEKVNNTLKLFTSLKIKPQFPAEYRDINRFKSYGDLAEVVDKFSGIKTKGEMVREKEKGITLMEEYDEYKLYVVTESEAGAKHFRNTKWCVKDPRYFDQYGAPYYYFTKNDEPYTLLHLNSNQCMDVQDRDTSLNQNQIDMMETEKMTKYVVDNDGSEDALYNYNERVGEGYDGIIAEYVEKQLNDLVSQYDFKHYHLYTDDISNEYYNASGFITYNFEGLEDYFDDRDFIKIVKNALNDINIYPDYLYSDNFSEDGVNVTIEYDSQSDYRSKTRMDKLRSFLDDLSNYDDSYESDIEKFEERLNENLLEKGYISSSWKTFKNKVLDNIVSDKYRNTFEKTERKKSNFFVLTFDNPVKTYPEDRNMRIKQVALEEKFFSLIRKNVNHIYVEEERGKIVISYIPSFDEDMSLDNYLRDFKIFKSLNIHFDDYQNQINNFYNYLHSGAVQTGREEIPVLTLRSRKSPPEQGYFQFKESKIKTFSQLLSRIK